MRTEWNICCKYRNLLQLLPSLLKLPPWHVTIEELGNLAESEGRFGSFAFFSQAQTHLVTRCHKDKRGTLLGPQRILISPWLARKSPMKLLMGQWFINRELRKSPTGNLRGMIRETHHETNMGKSSTEDIATVVYQRPSFAPFARPVS